MDRFDLIGPLAWLAMRFERRLDWQNEVADLFVTALSGATLDEVSSAVAAYPIDRGCPTPEALAAFIAEAR